MKSVSLATFRLDCVECVCVCVCSVWLLSHSPVQRVIRVVRWLWNEKKLVGRFMAQADCPQGLDLGHVIVIAFNADRVLGLLHPRGPMVLRYPRCLGSRGQGCNEDPKSAWIKDLSVRPGRDTLKTCCSDLERWRKSGASDLGCRGLRSFMSVVSTCHMFRRHAPRSKVRGMIKT